MQSKERTKEIVEDALTISIAVYGRRSLGANMPTVIPMTNTRTKNVKMPRSSSSPEAPAPAGINSIINADRIHLLMSSMFIAAKTRGSVPREMKVLAVEARKARPDRWRLQKGFILLYLHSAQRMGQLSK